MTKNNKNEKDKNKDSDKDFNFFFDEIDRYFQKKEKYILDYKHIPLEEILGNAPKYYSIISIIERINIFLSKNKNWLRDFIERSKIKFDLKSYLQWKSGRDLKKFRYTDTFAPSKWIHILQDYFISILEYIQILLIMEFYIDTKSYKQFLKDNPEIKHRMHLNFVRPSSPSENIADLFQTIDFLLQVCIQENFTIKFIVDTSLCMKVYREIDKSGIIELLKQKEFYIKYRLEYLKRTSTLKRNLLPYEGDVLKVAEEFMVTMKNFKHAYTEYKDRLIGKYFSVMNKLKKAK